MGRAPVRHVEISRISGRTLGWIWRSLATSGPSRLCNLHDVGVSRLIFVLGELPLELSLELHDSESGWHRAEVPPASTLSDPRRH